MKKNNRLTCPYLTFNSNPQTRNSRMSMLTLLLAHNRSTKLKKFMKQTSPCTLNLTQM